MLLSKRDLGNEEQADIVGSKQTYDSQANRAHRGPPPPTPSHSFYKVP